MTAVSDLDLCTRLVGEAAFEPGPDGSVVLIGRPAVLGISLELFAALTPGSLRVEGPEGAGGAHDIVFSGDARYRFTGVCVEHGMLVFDLVDGSVQ